ncbi:MAG: PilN domain-containing protein [Proteobacteria bacterium]|nr:PilN domain-containing protein [Pseudomonadota bacterium]
MIKINLIGDKKDYTIAILKHGTALALSVVAGIVACFCFYFYFSSELEIAKNEKNILDTQLEKLKEKTKKIENLEVNKKLLREKLTTIAKLKARKFAPVGFLSDLTSSMPERAWLIALKPKSEQLEVQGIALDPQTVSTFMTSLEHSKWVDSINLGFTKQSIKDDVPVQEFVLIVKIKESLLKKELEATEEKKI